MPTSQKHLSKLVTRLCQLPAQEKDEFGVKPQDIRDELGHALQRFAKSDEDATRIVDWLIFDRPVEDRKFRPGAGDIAEVARIIHEQQITEPPKGCEHCDGTGWRYVQRPAKDVITGEIYQADGRIRCDCALGKYLGVERKDTDQETARSQNGTDAQDRRALKNLGLENAGRTKPKEAGKAS